MGCLGVLWGYDTFYWSMYLICIAGTILQVILLVCLVRDPLKCFRNSATYLVVNLAVCDLAVVLEILFGTFHSSNPWLRTISYTPFFASILTISSISADRYMMVAHPFKHRLMINGNKATFWIGVLWILSVSCPLFLHLKASLTMFTKVKYAILAANIIFTLVMYILTFISLKRQAKSLRNENDRKTHKFRIANEQRFTKTIILIALVAVLSLTPATINEFIKKQVFRENKEDSDVTCIFITILSINFSINPIIYFLRLKNYRKTFFLVFCRSHID